MRHLWLLIAVALASSAHAQRVFVSNEKGGDVTVIDAQKNQVISTIPVGKRPRGIRISPDGKSLFVALSGTPISPPGQERNDIPSDKSADAIGIIDLKTLKLTGKLPSGSDPEQFSFSKTGDKLFIANEDINSATILDIIKRAPITTLKVGAEPEGVSTSPDGRLVYITSESTSEIHVIDTLTDAIVAHFKTSERPRGIAFLPDSSKAYITCENGGAIDVADVTSSRVIKQIKPPGQLVRPMGIVASPDGKHIYVTTGRGKSIVAIDSRTDEITGALSDVGARPWGIGISADGARLYTANGPSNDVTVIDAKKLQVLERIKAGESPWGIAVESVSPVVE